MPQKPSIRVRVSDGKPREWKKLKAALGTFVDVRQDGSATCFRLATDTERQLTELRPKLGALGLEELAEEAHAAPSVPAPPSIASPTGSKEKALDLDATEQASPKKPYSFVSLPKHFETKKPIWHDSIDSQHRLSGEIRFEIKNLTPLLVGWERQQAGKPKPSDLWPLPFSKPRTENGTEVVDLQLDKSYTVHAEKSVLCPLRAPWKDRPVLIPGDSIKGLLRHELGALLGAPMERVAERSYSYRPNLKFPKQAAGRKLEPRLARVLTKKTISVDGVDYPVPDTLDLLKLATRDQQKYYPGRHGPVAPTTAQPYRGGMGAGTKFPSECLSPDAQGRTIHTSLSVEGSGLDRSKLAVSSETVKQYERTLEHYFSGDSGHFSSRHPQIGNESNAREAGIKALKDGASRAFQPGDLIWVEWDTSKNEIVSFGWHYYYRWAYQNTVRKVFDPAQKNPEGREGLVPLREEQGDKPERLSAVRRLFGYAADDNNDGLKDVGKGNYSQLMGRISVNAAIEVIEPGKEKDEARFEKPIFLKELGQPKPSAVENYLKQPNHPNRNRPGDKATLVTYGDAAGYDTPGQLAGRKFYLDRKDAHEAERKKSDIEPWTDMDAKESNRLNKRSTLALEVSKPERRFRFTLRFRDLDPDELAAVLLALCPNQFANAVGGKYEKGYCSKLGYGRPLGLGSVCIEAKELLLLKDDGVNPPALTKEAALGAWFARESKDAKFPQLKEWLKVHQQKHPDAKDYERDPGTKEIFTVHTKLRAEHSRARRYK